MTQDLLKLLLSRLYWELVALWYPQDHSIYRAQRPGLFHHGIRRHRYFSPQAGGSTTELSATIKSEYASLSLSRVSSSRWPYCSYSEAVTVSGSEWALICSATELASTAWGYSVAPEGDQAVFVGAKPLRLMMDFQGYPTAGTLTYQKATSA